jgi:hypothetical protein
METEIVGMEPGPELSDPSGFTKEHRKIQALSRSKTLLGKKFILKYCDM